MDTEYVNNDLAAPSKEESHLECQQVCRKTPFCVGFTWLQRDKSCHLKHTLGRKKTHSNLFDVISGSWLLVNENAGTIYSYRKLAADPKCDNDPTPLGL